MKLISKTKVRVFEVLAAYKVKSKNAPFIAILKCAQENDNITYAHDIQELLLHPLSLNACKNLLNRLTPDYFIYNEANDEYKLTLFGEKAAKTQTFFDKRQGLLRVHLVENNYFIPNKIIKIEQLENDSYSKDKKEIKDGFNINIENKTKQIKLSNGIFTIDTIKSFYRENDTEEIDLNLKLNSKNTQINILDFTDIYKKNKEEITADLLLKEYDENYLKKEKIVKILFSEDTSLIRNLTINKPMLNKVCFNKCEIPNINVSPKNITYAEEWYYKLTKQRVNTYFLSENEFNKFANNIANEFTLFKDELKGTLNKEVFIKKLDPIKDFYIQSKIETIDYLTY